MNKQDKEIIIAVEGQVCVLKGRLSLQVVSIEEIGRYLYNICIVGI